MIKTLTNYGAARADAISARQVLVDRNCESEDIVRLAFAQRQIDGREPFVARLTFDLTSTAEALMPTDALIERRAAERQTITTLFRTEVGSVLVRTFPEWTSVWIAASCQEHVDTLVREIRTRAPAPVESGTVAVRTWYSHGEHINAHTRDIAAPTWPEIAGNYPTAVRAQLDALISAAAPQASGKLILWHGPPGTGKTTALRALMRSWADWCDVEYVADPERFFALPAYVVDVLGATPTRNRPQSSRAWQLVIAEDCDEYLHVSARRDAGASLGRLLNLTDGVLGQGYNTLILLTTNADIRRVHPALTRPGRCLAEIAFTPFSTTEAREWLADADSMPVSPVTLAELYAISGAVTTIRPADTSPAPGQYL